MLLEALSAGATTYSSKLHSNLYRERYIAISSTCSTKGLSITMTKFLSVVKD
jgi:hypothetical protein